MDNDLKASWNRLCDTLKGSAGYVFDPELGVDASEQAEGVRHHLRMLHVALDRILENNDPQHPELGWTHPSKFGQDNPDGLYQTAPVHLSRTYRWSNADTAPAPDLRLMPIAPIDSCLHPETPRLSADDRAALNAERRRHALRRFTR